MFRAAGRLRDDVIDSQVPSLEVRPASGAIALLFAVENSLILRHGVARDRAKIGALMYIRTVYDVV